jgi:hypothetical protein
MDDETPLDEKLPYDTRPMYFPNGASVEEFIIPDEDRELVLQQIYPFMPVPKLTDVMYDIVARTSALIPSAKIGSIEVRKLAPAAESMPSVKSLPEDSGLRMRKSSDGNERC